MKIYRVMDEYINYLQQQEPKVLENKKEKRPYIGVVYKINQYNYFVPLSSPKTKHLKMKNSKDFHKIESGKYGAINFNKIIPVPDKCLINFDIQLEADIAYRNLLQNQYKVLLTLTDVILNKALKIYEMFFMDDDRLTGADLKVKQRCCNFSLLEELHDEYTKIKG